VASSAVAGDLVFPLLAVSEGEVYGCKRPVQTYIRDFKKTDQAVLDTCDIPVRFFRPFGPFIITGNQANYLNWGVILL
jgi:hypothetical protein